MSASSSKDRVVKGVLIAVGAVIVLSVFNNNNDVGTPADPVEVDAGFLDEPFYDEPLYEDPSFDPYLSDDPGYDEYDSYSEYDPYSEDLDCVDIGEEVYIDGGDPNGLDADGDGIGCEGW